MSFYKSIQSAAHSMLDFSHSTLNKAFDKEKNAVAGREPMGHDPLGCVIFIATLKFRELGTKIQVTPSHLVAQEPSDYQYIVNWQWAARLCQSDRQEDLKCIIDMIRKAAVIYKPHLYKNANAIFRLAKEGLETLAQTYEMDAKEKSIGTARRIREYWIKTIDSACATGIDQCEDITAIDNLFKAVWTDGALDQVCEQLRTARTLVLNHHPKLRNSYSYLVKDTDEFLAKKREEVQQLLATEQLFARLPQND